jgi:hypothetical protein
VSDSELVMWTYLVLLPAYCVGSCVLAMLGCNDLGRMEVALTIRHRRTWFEMLGHTRLPSDSWRRTELGIATWCAKRSIRMPCVMIESNFNEFSSVIMSNADLFTAGITLVCNCSKTIDLQNFIANTEAVKALVTALAVHNFVCWCPFPSELPANTFTRLRNLSWSAKPARGEIFLQLVKRNPQLVNISVSGEQLTAEYVAGVVHCGGKLTKLWLHCTILTDAQTILIAQACTALTHLTLTDRQPVLTDVGVEAFATHCLRLQVIQLRVNAATTASLVALISHGRALQSIGISPPYCVDDSVIMALGRCHNNTNFPPAIRTKHMAVGGYTSGVRRVETSALQFVPEWRVTSMLAVKSAAPWLSQVSELVLVLDKSAEATFANAAVHFKQLKSLSVQDVISTALLTALAASCAGLTEVNIIMVANCIAGELGLALTGICRANSSLRCLAFSCTQLHMLDDTLLRAIAVHCSYFESLILNGCSRRRATPSFTDDGVLELVQSCRRLTRLRGVDNPTLTDNTVYAVARYCPVIHSLNLGDCTKLTEAALTHLVQCCPRLRSLLMPSEFTTPPVLKRIAAFAVNKSVADMILDCEPKYVGFAASLSLGLL